MGLSHLLEGDAGARRVTVDLGGHLTPKQKRAVGEATRAIRTAALAICLIARPLTSTAEAAAAEGTASEGSLAGATVTGLVLDAATSEPLPGAVVTLPELERGTITGADGRYSLRDVPAGPHHLAVSRIGYSPRTLHALLPREGLLEINVSLWARPLPIQSLDVRAPVALRGVELADSMSQLDREISIAAIRNYPLLTEPDVFQALEGGDVVSRPESPSGVHVRGGETDHLAYQIDGVPIFSPYHAAGLSSAWNPDGISRLQLRSADPSLSQPHTLSGTLDAVTRAPGDRVRGQGTFSATQASVTLDGPLGGAGAGYLLSWRAGFAGLLGSKDESSHLKGDTGDWLTKVEVPLFHGVLRLLGYASVNEIEAAATVVPEGQPEPLPRNTFDWRSRSAGAEWRRTSTRTGLRVGVWGAAGDAESGWRALAGPVRLAAERDDIGLLMELERRLDHGSVRGGMRLERATTSYRVEADSAFALDEALEARTPVGTLFGHYEASLDPRTRVTLGASLAVAEGKGYPSPRASLQWNPFRQLSLTGVYARAHQFVQSLRNPESVVGTIFPADLPMGTEATGVPTARGDEGVLSVDYRPGPGTRVSVQGFWRGTQDLVLVAPRSSEPFAIGSFATGTGSARGVALEGAWSAARYGIVASYGYQHVRLEHGDSSYVPEHGAEHVAQGGIIAFPTASLSVRLGGSAIWGRRTTTAVGELEWEACNLLDQGCEFAGSPHYLGDALGGTSLPTYYRVDLGARQHWHVGVGGRDVSLAVFAALTNLLGAKNVLTYTRNPGTGGIDAVEMRPRSPLVVGIEWRF